MNKTRILIASVLKPINDTRMYEKLGLSVAKLPTKEIHIAGFKAQVPNPSENKIYFHPIFSFKRLSLSRLFVSFTFFKLLIKIKPHLLIISTHELLVISILYKLISGTKIIYDVRENYKLNITSQNVYPAFIKYMLGGFILSLERFSANFLNGFFLAESSYANELPFIRNKYIILQNKFKPISFKQAILYPKGKRISANNIKLLYTGTISELYGVYEAIHLCQKLYEISAIYSLTIIGYCPQPEVFEKVRLLIKNIPYIKLIGGNYLVSHTEIIEAINESSVGLIPYRSHPSLNNCVPTKLFEYIGNALPVIATQNKDWHALIMEYEAGFTIDFTNPDAEYVHEKLQSSLFYRNKILENMYWDSEEEKLLNWLKQNNLVN